MSDASTLMAMKRMNVVAADLDRRARLIVDEARQGETAKEQTRIESEFPGSGNSGRQSYSSSQALTGKLEWDWAYNGVEAWPNMDFMLASM